MGNAVFSSFSLSLPSSLSHTHTVPPPSSLPLSLCSSMPRASRCVYCCSVFQNEGTLGVNVLFMFEGEAENHSGGFQESLQRIASTPHLAEIWHPRWFTMSFRASVCLLVLLLLLLLLLLRGWKQNLHSPTPFPLLYPAPFSLITPSLSLDLSLSTSRPLDLSTSPCAPAASLLA